ncbi:hypothetical protein [Phenylobacterium sp.]|uniref:hypothetical protein n=1 Tax=Phenylobacterium sp. TaxID=1871053 RepID=UPI003784E9BD
MVLAKRGALAAVFMALAGHAAAQEAPAGSALVQQLTDCRKLTADAARLACFDAATAALAQAEAKGEIVVVDRAQAQAVQRQAFGFSLPSLSLFDRGPAQGPVDSVTGKVAQARTDANGKWIVRLVEGGTWAQVDSATVMRPLRPGMEVRISRASLGSFQMSVGGQRAFRARRTE